MIIRARLYHGVVALFVATMYPAQAMLSQGANYAESDLRAADEREIDPESFRRAAPTRTPVRRVAPKRAHPDFPDMPLRVAPTLHVRLRAGEQTSLALPIPTALHRRDSIGFELHRAMTDALSGAGAGVFMSDDATVPITVRAHSRLSAGSHRIGDIRFWSADGRGERIIVPVQLTIVETTTAPFAATSALRTTADASASLSASRVRVAATTYVSAPPRTVQLVSVSLPAALLGEDSISVAVLREPGASVTGPPDGLLAEATARVMLSVSVPANALAGRTRVAEVRFRNLRDSSTHIVPVEAIVDAVRAVSVVTSAPLTHAVQGRTTTVRVVITNGGNVEDTVSLGLAVPERWRGKVRDRAPIVLAPGAAVARDIELTPPTDQSPGATSVALRAVRVSEPATASDTEQRTLRVPVEVLPRTGASPFGPVLGVSYSAVQQPGQPVAGSWALSLYGPLARGVNISASWTQRAVFGAPGLSRVGGGELFPSVALLHPRWRMDMGNAAADLGELAGLVRNGRGVSGSYGDSTWQFSALAARPLTFAAATSSGVMASPQFEGLLAGARLRTVQNGVAWVSGVSHLRDPLLMRAQLDAFTIGAERANADGIEARGELAWRRWADGAALGGAAEFGRRQELSDWRIRASHAPGGSRAFARAQTDVTMTGGQRLGRTRIGYVGFYATDGDANSGDAGSSAGVIDPLRRGTRQHTQGIAIMPQWTIGRGNSIGLEARVGSSASGDATARLSTMSQVLGLFSATRIHAITATTTATYTRSQRGLTFTGETDTRLEEAQINWTGQLVWPAANGTFDVYSSLQRRTGGAALSDGQHDLVLRAEGLAVPLLRNRVHASAAVGRLTSLSTGNVIYTQRAGLSAVLPMSTYLRLDLERNPFVTFGGNTGWITALRIERSFGTPGFLRGGRGTGVVFEDLNGNGVRDEGERGLPGVLVRVGGEVVITDRGGVYRLTRATGGVPELDERSLPFGLMLAPQLARGTSAGVHGDAFDIPVVPVGAVEVRLELAADATLARTPTMWSGVTVSARDAAGRRHVALLLADGRAVFEALPPGTYQLEIDGSGAVEPLSVEGVAPSFTLAGAREPRILRVTMGPRRLRMFVAPPAQRPAAAGHR